MRMSEGRKSVGAIFFLMRDCCRETADPALLLPLEIDVALDREMLSFMVDRGGCGGEMRRVL